VLFSLPGGVIWLAGGSASSSELFIQVLPVKIHLL
jgi:hypothetical protein